MTPDDLVIQRPAGPAQQLILLFHGAGSNPQAMRALGERLCIEFPNAAIVAAQAPKPHPQPGLGQGAGG